MLTARQLVLHLLGYRGVTQLSKQPEDSGLDNYRPQDGYEAVACINGALQEIYSSAPRWFSHRPQAYTISPPTPVTFTATVGSVTISAATPSNAFMRGCTLPSCGGDVIENEIVNSTTLLRPFQGVTGTVSAMLYGDCLSLDPSIAVVNPPVILQGYRELFPAANYSDLLDMDYRYRATFGNYGTSVAVTSRAQPRTVAQPLGYMVDTFVDPATGSSSFALRFVPIPDGAYVLRFEARLVPRVISISDIGADNAADPGVTFGLPNGWDEMILLPVALQRWTASALFSRREALSEIQRAYTVAMQQIISATRPQAVAKQKVRIGCY